MIPKTIREHIISLHGHVTGLKKDIDISDLEEGLAINKTQTLVLSKEIELLKVQIEEIKLSTSNPLTN